MNTILTAEFFFFKLELGNSGTEKLSILNKVTRFTGSKLGFEPTVRDSTAHASNQIASSVYATYVCHTPPLVPPTSHSTALASGFSPTRERATQSRLAASLLILLLSTFLSPIPVLQATFLTL